MFFTEDILYEFNQDEYPELTSYEMLEQFFEVMIEEEAEQDIDTLTEGANIDVTKKFITLKKEFKEKLKAAKKAHKDKDVVAVQKNLKAASVVLDNMKKELKDMKSTEGSVAFGKLMFVLISLSYFTIPIIIHIISAVIGKAAEKKGNAGAAKYGDGFADGIDAGLDKAFNGNTEENNKKAAEAEEKIKQGFEDMKSASKMSLASDITKSSAYGWYIGASISAVAKGNQILNQMKKKNDNEGTSKENKNNMYRAYLLSLVNEYKKMLDKVAKEYNK